MAAARRLEIVIAGEPSGALKAMDKIERKSKSFSQKLSSVGKKLTIGVTLPLAAAMGAAAKAASEEQQEMALLEKTLKRNVKVTDEQVEGIEEWITAVQNTVGVADSELRPALSKLVIATDDVERAQTLLSIALDVSAARGKSLESVVDALVKAQNGQMGGLGRLGVKIKDAEGKARNFGDILHELSQTMGGAASAKADTAAGKMEILKLKFGDLQEQIGTALLPMLEQLAGALSSAADWFAKLSDNHQKVLLWSVAVIFALGPVIATLGKLSVAVKGVGAAFTLLTSHPVITFLVLLAGALYYAYQRWQGFRDAVWYVLITVALFFNYIRQVALPIWDDFVAAVDEVQGVFQHFLDILNDVWDLLVKIGDKIPDIKLPGTGGGPGIGIPEIPGPVDDVLRGLGVHFAHGGRVPGLPGQAVPIIAHGGETVGHGRGDGPVFQIISSANPQEIGREVLWSLRRLRGSR